MSDSSISDLINRRYSCRSYLGKAVAPDLQGKLGDFLADNGAGPLGTAARFVLLAATDDDRQALKGLGTYGIIRGASAFIAGAVAAGPKNMEDFGYLMEQAVLFATGLGLGTCWLGGIFTKSSFARKLGLTEGETMPAVTALGYSADRGGVEDRMRRYVGADNRLPDEQLFFDGDFTAPLPAERMGAFAEVLAAVRRAPSASNKQPWRLIRTPQAWHFYLRRTKGYGHGSLIFRLLRLADLQRVDLGIAMCHFALTAAELGLKGRWLVQDPGLNLPERTEYTVSWLREG